MGTGPADQPPLKVDPELLGRYGGQLLSAAGDLPSAPPPFTVTGSDAISQAIAEKLPSLEGAIQDALPQLKDDASNTASNVIAAASRYSTVDAQLASNYEKHQFDSTGTSGGGGASGGGANSMSQLGQMMSMPMQMASQGAQLPMQAVSAVAQQVGQVAGGLSGSGTASGDGVERPEDRRDENGDRRDAAPDEAKAERAPATTSAPQQGWPRRAAPDPGVNL